MFKRTLAASLCAIMLAAAVAPGAVGANRPSSLATDPNAPYSVTDGAISVPFGTTASELLSCFTGRESLTLAGKGGEEIAGAADIGSGATVSAGEESAAVVVPGDVNGDAKINVRDVLAAMKIALGDADAGFAAAANVEADAETNARDVVKLMRYLVGWNETLGETPDPSGDPALGMYFDSILHRIGRSDTTVYGTADGLIRAAKNEVEDAQIVLTSTEAKSGLTLEVGAPENADGDRLGVEVRYGYYYHMAMFNDLSTRDFSNYTDDDWVDPYPPLGGQAFDVGANESKSFMAQITVPADAKSGWYAAPVVVRDTGGGEIRRAALRVYVWDFALDEETACNTLFSTWSSGTAGYYAKVYEDRRYHDVEFWAPIYKENFVDFLLEYRISGYELPYDILDSRVDEYLDDPRVTAFVAKGGMGDSDLTEQASKNRLRAIYDKLETNPVWAEKAYIYTVDEPYSTEGADLVIDQWNSVKSILGDTPFKTIVPYGNWYLSEKKVDQLEYLWDFCNCFCPSEGVFTPSASSKERIADPVSFPVWGEYMDNHQFQKYGNYQPRYEKLRERGDSMWWYVCCAPVFPYANFFNYYQGEWTRVVLWLQYIIHADGLLYWSTNSWTLSEHDSRLINLKRTNTGGDGTLIYDGMLWGSDVATAVPTSRLEAIRDGIEDFQYFAQLERVLGRDATLAYVTRLATDVTHFEQDYRLMERVRCELGFALEGLSD